MSKQSRTADKNLTLEQIKEKYFYVEKTAEQLTAEHLLHLAECEETRRNDGTYSRISDVYKQNSVKRINRYINNRTEAEKLIPEYKIFIESMNKSLAIFQT